MLWSYKEVLLGLHVLVMLCFVNGKVRIHSNKRNHEHMARVSPAKHLSTSLKGAPEGKSEDKGLTNGVRKNLASVYQRCGGATCVPVPVPIPITQVKDIPVPVPTKVDTVKNVLRIHIHDGNPCKNGGMLSRDHHGATYHCVCPPQYIGTTCDVRQYCFSEPCHNGGSCLEIANGYKCLCRKGFSGEDCEDQRFCIPSPCGHDGTCVETLHGYKCVCHDGFTGSHCTDVDPCFPNPCLNGGKCENSNSTALCHCPPEYHGDFCHEHYICLVNPCHNGGKCVENLLAPCECPRGYIGRYCHEHVCRKNPCQHGGICKAVENPLGSRYHRWTHKCFCRDPYRGRNCHIPHPCMHITCLNGGTCEDDYTTREIHEEHSTFDLTSPTAALNFVCNCLPGFTGPRCEHDICALCDPHAECVNFHCVCKLDYVGDGYHCKREEGHCHSNPCYNDGTCTEGPQGSYDCHCVPGYCGPNCKDICEPCILFPCLHGARCIPKGSERTCICVPPYVGPDCNVTKPSLCEPNPCKNGGKCVYLPEQNDFICEDCMGKYTGKDCSVCDCPKAQPIPGRVVVDAICDAVGECRCPSNVGDVSYTEKGCVLGRADPCANRPCERGTCIANPDGVTYRCIDCPPPYYGTRCECTTCTCENPCKNGATCQDIGTKQYKCTCAPGYTGPDCAEKITTVIIKRHCHANVCQNGGTCMELPNGYDCICTPQYTGPHCGIDKCANCDVNAKCIHGRCRCRSGYIGTGYVCEKINKESECGICPTNYICVESTCVCSPGSAC